MNLINTILNIRKRRIRTNRILIVDDENHDNLVLKTLLELNAFEMELHDDPLMVLTSFKPKFYDLVILGIGTRNIHGFPLFREIRQIDNKIKICFISTGEFYFGAYTDIFSTVDASHFIRRPISNEHLLERIDNITNTYNIQT